MCLLAYFFEVLRWLRFCRCACVLHVTVVMQLFPKAQFIYMHRNPVDVFASAANMADKTCVHTPCFCTAYHPVMSEVRCRSRPPACWSIYRIHTNIDCSIPSFLPSFLPSFFIRRVHCWLLCYWLLSLADIGTPTSTSPRTMKSSISSVRSTIS